MATKPKNAEMPNTEKTETVETTESDIVITDEIQAIINNPVEIEIDGNMEPIQMALVGKAQIELLLERSNLLLPIWEKLIKTLDEKKSSVKQGKSVNEQVRSKILATITSDEELAISAAFRKAFTLIESVCGSDAASIIVSERLAHMADVYGNVANENVHLFGIPSDLKQESSSSLVGLFNDVHAACKEIIETTNGVYEGFHGNWKSLSSKFDPSLYRLNAAGEPMHPKDLRQLKSKYVKGDNGDSPKTYTGKRYNVTLAFKIGKSNEVVRDLTTAYRDPQFAMHNFMRELNRAIAKANANVRQFPISELRLAVWIRAQNENIGKDVDTHDAINKHSWTVTIPDTDIVIRRVVPETTVIATSTGKES